MLTLREVVALVTIYSLTAFSVGFLLAAFTRIFKERSADTEDYVDWAKVPLKLCDLFSNMEYVIVQPWGSVLLCGKEPMFNYASNSWKVSVPVVEVDRSAIIGVLPSPSKSLRRRPS